MRFILARTYSGPFQDEKKGGVRNEPNPRGAWRVRHIRVQPQRIVAGSGRAMPSGEVPESSVGESGRARSTGEEKPGAKGKPPAGTEERPLSWRFQGAPKPDQDVRDSPSYPAPPAAAVRKTAHSCVTLAGSSQKSNVDVGGSSLAPSDAHVDNRIRRPLSFSRIRTRPFIRKTDGACQGFPFLLLGHLTQPALRERVADDIGAA